MSGTPANSPADAQVSSTLEVKTALSGFFQEFKSFQTDIKKSFDHA